MFLENMTTQTKALILLMPFGLDIPFFRISIGDNYGLVQMRMTNRVLFVIVKTGKNSNVSLKKLKYFKNKKLIKLWYSHKMEYYLEIKLNF